MANYKFDNINAGLTIKAPAISLDSIIDNFDGTALVFVRISLGNPQADAVSFVVELGVYNYSGDQAIKDDVQTWLNTELTKYEV